MALSVVLTINSIPYDVADYVMRDSIIIDESLFNDKDLRPTTNKASFILSRDCPYIDELFAWSDDVPITISLDGVLAFTGYLTDDHSLSIGTTGAREVKIDAEDPGIRKLKVSWVSTDTLSTIFNGDKVCDPADTGNSFVHILAGLAGVNLATMPTISAPLYFTVKDSDSKDYWGILADVLFEHQYVFYFNAAGELALFSLASLTGTPSQMVSTSADVLAKNGDIGIKVTKRLLTWKQVDVKFREAETLAGAVIYRDTTGQTAINDCDIPLAGGAYYPSTCDASTYAYIDYFLEDGREILSVGSAASDFVVDSGITAAFTNIGLSAQIRFLNTLGITADIRKLKVAGTNVVAVKAQSKVIAGESSKFRKEYEAKYLTDKTKATELANLLYYFYKNSSSTYKWRSYMGTLYPSETLFPAATLYPLGDLIALGEKIDLKDPVFSGLDVDVAVTKRKYRLGYYGADYEGVGIGTITLSSVVGYTPTAPAIIPGPKYLATKPLTADPLGATPDPADFVGQYGVYAGQRYVCTALPSTWALDDAGQTASEVASLIVTYTPKCLGLYAYANMATITGMHDNDMVVLYSSTLEERGIYAYISLAWTKQTTPTAEQVSKCFVSVLDAVRMGYGVSSDYVAGSTSFETLLVRFLYALKMQLDTNGAIYSGGYNDQGDNDGNPGAYISGTGAFAGVGATFESLIANSLQTLVKYVGSWVMGTWGSESTVNATGSNYPSLAVLSDGRVLCVYRRYSDGYLVQCIRATNGTWGSESTVNAANSYYPSLAVLPDGRVLCVYQRINDYYLVQRIQTTAGTWGSESIVNAADTTYPSLAVFSDGQVLCVYRRSSDGYIVQRIRATSGTWGSESTINAANSYPSLAVLSDGRVLCVYRRGSDGYLVQRIRATSGTWGSESTVNAANSFYPSLAVLPDDRVLCVYQRASDHYLVQRIRATSGTWGSESIINAVSSAYSSLAVLSDGRVLCVYRRDSVDYLFQRLDTSAYSSIPVGNFQTDVGTGIVEVGQNSDGTYIKFGDGTMICHKTVGVTTAISTATGNIYYNDSVISCGNWPVYFSSTPEASVSLIERGSTFAWIVAQTGITTSGAGSFELASSASRSADTYKVSSIGIGRWK